MKGCQIQALEDGQGIGIVSSEGEKGRVIPFRDISVGGVIILVNFIPVPRERRKDKNTWTGERRHRRGGGGEEREPLQQDPYFFCRDVSGERIATPSRQ